MDAQEPEQAAVGRPLTLPYVPFGHGAQAEAPAAAHVPGSQMAQEAAPLALKVPAAHGVQAVWFRPRELPAAHAVQVAVAPRGTAAPM